MIRRLVDFALQNRLLVLAIAVLLFAWGAISFHQLPVEAYPDVANNYVDVITQWPNISAEQIEQQITIPLEIVMNGIPGIVHLRSFSLFGLSYLDIIFDEDKPTQLRGIWYDLHGAFSRAYKESFVRNGGTARVDLPVRGRIEFQKLYEEDIRGSQPKQDTFARNDLRGDRRMSLVGI